MDSSLITSVTYDNPWLRDEKHLPAWLAAKIPDTFLPRNAAEHGQQRWREPRRAHLLVGPRQAGKSTAIWAHLHRRAEPVLYIDCEQALVRDWCRSPPLFLSTLETLLARPVALFFDEVQHLDEAGLFFKGLVDRRFPEPILVTGSSSFHLGARTRESLAGRATRTRLLPFSFFEVCGDLDTEAPALRQQRLENRLARHQIYGGYPDVWLGDQPAALLTDLVEAVILRDASDLHRISRPDAFRRLLRLAAGQIGNLINFSEWASLVGISRDTVASYCEILESGHVVALVPPFAGGRRAELTSRPKLFFVDNGIRNQLVNDFRPVAVRTDRGAVLKNWVFTELRKALPAAATLHFWRSASGAEVDFVVVRGEEIVGIEVKATRLRRATLPRSSRSFIDAYRPATFLVVNGALSHHQQVGDTEVRWIEPQDLIPNLPTRLL